jgi:hypothetical protein
VLVYAADTLLYLYEMIQFTAKEIFFKAYEVDITSQVQLNVPDYIVTMETIFL